MKREQMKRAIFVASLALLLGGTTVDAQVTEVQKLIAPDADSMDYFGEALAIDGNTLVVGVPQDTIGGNYAAGSAYVFVRSGGTWSFQAKLTAYDGKSADNFGFSVDIIGDLIAVGAPGHDVTPPDWDLEGKVYLFRHDGTIWTLEAELTPVDNPGDFEFGSSVAINNAVPEASTSGEVVWNVVVAAPGYDSFGTGAVYVFELSPDGTVWNYLGLFTPDGYGYIAFGSSVASCGDQIIIGAMYCDDRFWRAGAVMVYRRTGMMNAWSLWNTYYASDGWESDYMGSPVATYCGPGAPQIPGTVIKSFMAGAPWKEDDLGRTMGVGYLFPKYCEPLVAPCTERDGFIASDTEYGDFFATSLAMHGSHVIVGAPFDEDAGWGSGSAYLFLYGQAVTQLAKLVAHDADAGDNFGAAVAYSGDTMIVAAPRDDHSSLGDAGSVYVFLFESEIFADGFESGDTTRWSVSVQK